MKVIVNRNLFIKSLNLASSVYAKEIRFVFNLETETLKILSRSETSGFYTFLPVVVDDSSGVDVAFNWDAILAPLLKWANNCPGNKDFIFSFDNKDRLVVKSGRSRSTLNYREGDSLYPKMPYGTDNLIASFRAELCVEVFGPAMKLAKASMGKDATGILNFVGIDISDTHMYLFATDKGAALMSRVPVVSAKSIRLFPAAQAIMPMSRYIPDEFSSVELHAIDRYIYFKFNDVIFYFTNNPVDYPIDDLRDFFEHKDREVEMILDSTDFTNGVSSVEGYALYGEKIYPRVRLQPLLDDGDAYLQLDSIDEEAGNTNVQIYANLSSEAMTEIYASAKYLKLAISAVNEESIRIMWSENLRNWIYITGKMSDKTKLLIAPIIV